MAAPIIQASFSAGELSPHLHGRVDLNKYKVGAAKITTSLLITREVQENGLERGTLERLLIGMEKFSSFLFSLMLIRRTCLSLVINMFAL